MPISSLRAGSCANLIDSVRLRPLRYEYVYMAEETLIDLPMEQHEVIIDCIARRDFESAAKALATNYDWARAMVLSKLGRR